MSGGWPWVVVWGGGGVVFVLLSRNGVIRKFDQILVVSVIIFHQLWLPHTSEGSPLTPPYSPSLYPVATPGLLLKELGDPEHHGGGQNPFSVWF